ncbi:MAG TPA: prephenate dehydratase domain-containing protein, partial [Calditrichia bacterium]|nr:prephenate dehydratase domain-containing protein [Calditrichia bacterium]
AELYHLEIIAADIENLKDNYTRFLVLSRQGNPHHPLQNKASLNFTLAHSVGSLAGALNIFGAHDLNMTLIQSVPIPRKPHEYAFHVDVVWEQRENFEKAMRDLRQHTGELRILGIYQKGERPYDRQTR